MRAADPRENKAGNMPALPSDSTTWYTMPVFLDFKPSLLPSGE